MANAFQVGAFQTDGFQVQISVTVIVTGVEIIGSIGTVTVSGGSLVIVTGVDATGSIGSVFVASGVVAIVTGV